MPGEKVPVTVPVVSVVPEMEQPDAVAAPALGAHAKPAGHGNDAATVLPGAVQKPAAHTVAEGVAVIEPAGQ